MSVRSFSRSRTVLVFAVLLSISLCIPVFSNVVQAENTIQSGNGNTIPDDESDGNLVTGYDNTVHYNADNNAVSGENNWVIGNSNTVSGSENELSSDHSAVSGHNNKVSGVYNTVSGADNTVKGASGCNAVSGAYNTVDGLSYYNAVSGENNAVYDGFHNLVSGSGNNVTGDNNVALMGATVSGSNLIGMGSGAAVSGDGSAAIGNNAQATHTNSVALGAGSVTGAANTVSLGSAGRQRRITHVAAGVNATDGANLQQVNAAAANTLASARAYTSGRIAVNNTGGHADPTATGDNAMAVGPGAVASAANTLAVGTNARATGTNAIAIGAGALATGSVAVGTEAAAANGGSAVGDYAVATGNAGAALGRGASSTGDNSAAIGAASTDDGQANVVSVGSAGNERRVTHVATGVAPTDAVNLYQAHDLAENALISANAYTDGRIDSLDRDLHRDLAGAIAMARATIPLNPGESGLALGIGNSNGENAVALSFQYYTKRNIYLNISSSLAGGRFQTGGGIGFKF